MNLLINANSLHIPLTDQSVHCVVTSPPYYGLRDYGVPGQLGLEPTPDEYIHTMVQVFREVWRVLRDDGTLWLNIGDSYAGSGKGGQSEDKRSANWQPNYPKGQKFNDIKPKDMIGIPWMLAFALRSDGWYLRQDIIWHKPNPMPESAGDRCTKAHEYIFLLTKKARYFYDQEAVLEPASENTHLRVSQDIASQAGSLRAYGGKKANGPMKVAIRTPKQTSRGSVIRNNKSFDESVMLPVIKRNKRSVWTVTTKPYSGAHYAVFPPDLIEPGILAGTSEKGVCPGCGAPWERLIKGGFVDHNGKTKTSYEDGSNAGRLALLRQASREIGKEYYCNNTTTGWQPTCDCGIKETVPAVVLDPFAGSGTTLMVARKHGRNGVGIDLSFDYLNTNARERLVYGGFVPIADGIQQLTIEGIEK